MSVVVGFIEFAVVLGPNLAPKQRRLKMSSAGTDPLRDHRRWLPEGQTVLY